MGIGLDRSRPGEESRVGRLDPSTAPSSSLNESSGGAVLAEIRERAKDLNLTPAQLSFLHDVILKETPNIPKHITLESTLLPDGTSALELSHRSTVQGQEVGFSYQIRFTDTQQPKTPFKPKLNETNVIEVPSDGPKSAEDLYRLQCAWRRVTIADPHLYATHAGGKVQMREYQEEGVRAGLESLRRKEHPLLSMFTGTGKTHVGFEVMDRYLRELPDQESRGKVIFLVNNRTILDEAAKSLNRAKPGYKTSMSYDGVVDTGGDVIFATPGTLTGAALERLLKDHKIAMVISDETHHLPAEGLKGFYNRVEEAAASRGEHTAFLGLTATPIRPDQKSVIGFFNSNVAFRYDYSRAYYEGYLPAIIHHGKDMDMQSHSGEFSKVPILPGSPQYQEHCKERYAQARIPRIVEYYQECAAGKIDKRALAICPDVDAAKDLSTGFNLSGIPAAALTSELTSNRADFERFKATYEAFKKGKWAELDGKPAGDGPVPMAVTSVAMFKEGIDVPGIGIVVFWTDTSSMIALTQGIGRGARPAPGKTHLDVLDVVGLYRKLEYISFLSQFADRSEEKPGQGKGTAGGTPREFGLEDLERHLKNPNAYDNNVTQVLTSFLDNVPNTLQQLYQTYPNIPRHEREHLDRFIMGRINELTPDAAPKSMDETASRAADLLARWKDVPPREKAQLRRELYAAFSYEEINLDAETGNILVTPVTKVIYSRLFQRVQEANPALPIDALSKVLHEFDPKHETELALTAGNLRALRERGFRLTSEQMTNLLIDKVLEAGRLDGTESPLAHGHLSMERDSVRKDQEYFLIDRAETARVERNVSVLGFSQGASTVLGTKEFQDAVIGAYVRLPELDGKISAEDFRLESRDFEELLVQRGLLKAASMQPASVDKGITALGREFLAACQSRNSATIVSAGAALREFLDSENTVEFFRFDPVQGKNPPRKTAKNLLTLAENVEAAHHSGDATVRGEIESLLPALERVLSSGAIRFTAAPQELHGRKIRMYRRLDARLDGANADFDLRVDAPTGAAPSKEHDPVVLRIREDATGRFQCLTERPPKSVSGWENTHHDLGFAGRSALVSETVGLLEHTRRLYGERFGMVITSDKVPSQPFSELMDTVVQRTNWNVIGQVENLASSGGSLATPVMLADLSRSRTDLSVMDLAQYGHPEIGGQNLPRLSALFATLYMYRSQINPLWQEAKSTLEAAPGSLPEKAVHEFLLGQVDRILHVQGTGVREMNKAKRVLVNIPENPADVPAAYPVISEAGFRMLEDEGNRHGSPIYDRYNRTFSAANACIREIEDPRSAIGAALVTEFRAFMRETVERYALVQKLPDDFRERVEDFKARFMEANRIRN